MVVIEEFVVRVFKGGKVTIPKRLTELFGVYDGEFELDSVKLIHDSLVDLLENESMNKPRRRHKA